MLTKISGNFKLKCKIEFYEFRFHGQHILEVRSSLQKEIIEPVSTFNGEFSFSYSLANPANRFAKIKAGMFGSTFLNCYAGFVIFDFNSNFARLFQNFTIVIPNNIYN